MNDIEYVELKETTSQYDDLTFETGKPVKARYIKATLDMDKGNPFIEALPLQRNDREIENEYFREIPLYSLSKIQNMSTFEKMTNVGSLRELRFNLPFHEQLEYYFYNSLLTSYRSRNIIGSKNSKINNFIEGEKKEGSAILSGDSAASTNAGFSLIGYSGCGKSSAIKTLVSHYPQVIIHNLDEYGYFPQITYLVVNCVANSNFAALYEGIGDAIDKALGNIEPVYAKEIRQSRNLGVRAEKIKVLIERFAIGAIIFDEIQLIDFAHTKENTFDSLLTLANKTKVAIAVVGTEDAKSKMFSELRTSRRLGAMINGNAYCDNKKFFDSLAMSLFEYQWFDNVVEYDDEISGVLYDLTKGIIDQLIGIYITAHIEYLQSKKKPKVNGEFFKKITNKYFPGIQSVLADMENTDNVSHLNKIRMEGYDKLEGIIDAEKQKDATNKIIASSEKKSERKIELNNVMTNIKNIYDDFSDNQIQEAYIKIMNRKSSEDKTEKDITKLVLEQLQKLPKSNVKKGKVKISSKIDDYKSFLNIKDEED